MKIELYRVGRQHLGDFTLQLHKNVIKKGGWVCWETFSLQH